MKSFLAALLAATAMFGQAQAAPLALDETPTTQARQIVNVVFADYLRERVGVVVQTTALDLDSDGVGEIVARFVHSGSCDAAMERCRTVILRHSNRSWRILLDRPSEGVEVLETGRRVPARVKVDGITWSWASPVYAPTAEGMGERVDFSAMPQENAKAIAGAFGQGAAKLAEAGQGISFEYARPAISEDAEFLIVKLDGQVACGDFTGCPVRLLRKNGETWSPILSTHTKGDITIGKAVRNGYRDIVVRTQRGFAVMGWNGNGYSVADRIERAGDI